MDVICPDCAASDKQSIVYVVIESGYTKFHDKEGRFHVHPKGHKGYTDYHCEFGHSFRVERFMPLWWCCFDKKEDKWIMQKRVELPVENKMEMNLAGDTA